MFIANAKYERLPVCSPHDIRLVSVMPLSYRDIRVLCQRFMLRTNLLFVFAHGTRSWLSVESECVIKTGLLRLRARSHLSE